MCRFTCKEDEVVVSNSFQKMMPLGVQLKLGRSNAPRGDAAKQKMEDCMGKIVNFILEMKITNRIIIKGHAPIWSK